MNVATAAVGDSVRHFAAWWSTELKTLVPPTIRRWFGQSGHVGRLVVEKDGTVAIHDNRHSDAAYRAVYQTLEEAVETGKLLLQRSPLQVILTDGDCFGREVMIPRGARSRVRSVLAIELEQSTPFRVDDIYWGCRLQPGSQAGWIAAKQFIAKRTRVHAILEPLRDAGATVQSVGAQDSDGTFVSLFALPERPLTRMVRLLAKSAVVALLASSVLLAGTTVALLFHRQNVAMAELEADIERMRQRAVAVRTRLDQMRATSQITDGLLRRKFEAVPLVAVLEEASRLLPDTAWVTELHYEGVSASLTGEARSAPELINILEASNFFSQVAFVAPVTRAAASETESFSIKLAIESAGTPDAAAPQAQR
jgi:general secretion pathway protein L